MSAFAKTCVILAVPEDANGFAAGLISLCIVGSTPTSDTWPQGHVSQLAILQTWQTIVPPHDRFFARPANDTANVLTIGKWIAIVIEEPHTLQRQIKT
jgi:hypothetical protein